MQNPQNSEADDRPGLLLHICCGPCATSVVEALGDSYAVTGYFYNPNIFPEDEHRRRRDAAVVASLRQGFPLIEGAYDHDRFLATVRGFEEDPENGGRCLLCYRLRLEETARYAAENGFPFIATTLTTGPRKQARIINPIGEAAAQAHGVSFLCGDWKKRDGYRRSCELAHEFGLYRQHYCGCEFSLRDAPKSADVH